MEAKDPLAPFLGARLKLSPLSAALVGLALGLFLILLPATFGFLHTPAPGRLGSLDDWHTQVLVLIVAPSIWAFYLWQPQTLRNFRDEYIPASWRLSALIAIGAVIYDMPEMFTTYGQWWAAANPLIIAFREALLFLNGYMLATIAQRHLHISWGRQEPMANADREQSVGLERYYLGGAVLWGILGSRLSIEVIELPARAGGITPDFYLKTLLYLLLALALFIAPLPRPTSASLTRFLIIIFIPVAFLILFWGLGLEPQFAF